MAHPLEDSLSQDTQSAAVRQSVLPGFIMLSAVLLASVCLPMPGPSGRILGIPSICPFYEMTGLPCPGCGLTRAFVCLGHGDWRGSLHWHPLGWLVYGVFLLLWARAGATLVIGRRFLPGAPGASYRLALGTAAALLLADIARIGWLTTHHLRF